MGRLHHLKQTLPAIVNQTDDYILVDYSCPDMSGAWAVVNYNVKVVYVPGEKMFHHARARNIGAMYAKYEWLCFIDADMLVLNPTLIKDFFVGRKTEDRMFSLNKYDHGYCGFLVVHRKHFEAVSGYNEKMVGWGYEDLDIKYRLQQIGVRRIWVKSRNIKHIDHDDAERVQFVPIKDIRESNAVNYYMSDEYSDIKSKIDVVKKK